MAAEAPSDPHVSAICADDAAPPVNVLLVDDRADKLLALESILADGDHKVVTARSGAEALRALLRDDFAVILLDVNMPQLDGFQTAALIRGRPSSEKTPIIFMTAVSDVEAGISRGYSLGAVDYIHLPVQPEVLKAKVSVFVDLYRKREQVREQAELRRLREEREHAKRLAEAADRLDFETRRNRFFTLAPDMLGIAGFDGRLRQLNASWERTLGISAQELCGRPTFEFLHPEDQQAMRDHLRDLAAGAPTARFENRHRHGDGSYRWLAWTAAPFREEGLVYVFARDVTFRKVAEDERLELVREQEARRAAERENTIKDQFLATLSHELRSPLTPILGWTTMLRSGQLGPDDTSRAIDVIERNAHLQAQLIDDLLDVSRIVSGKLRMDLRPIDLRGVVEAALDAVRTAAEKRRVTLAVELGSEAVRVVGDPERLQQVVWNLAANAVKFSPEDGCVQVHLDLGPMPSLSGSATMAWASARNSCPTCSIGSSRPRRGARGPMAGWGWGSPSCGTSCRPTAEPPKPRATGSGAGRPSPSSFRARAYRNTRRRPPPRPHRERRRRMGPPSSGRPSSSWTTSPTSARSCGWCWSGRVPAW